MTTSRKFTREEVEKVEKLLKDGITRSVIGKHLGMTVYNIDTIIARSGGLENFSVDQVMEFQKPKRRLNKSELESEVLRLFNEGKSMTMIQKLLPIGAERVRQITENTLPKKPQSESSSDLQEIIRLLTIIANK